VAAKWQAEIIALEIMADQVHVLVEVDPQFGIHRFVTISKAFRHTPCGKSFAP